MSTTNRYIFGYGSLMNPESLAVTSTTAKIIARVKLNGYQRKVNAMSDAYPEVAMNIVPSAAYTVEGVLIEFPEADMPQLQTRETGYRMVDVTKSMQDTFDQAVYTFIAPNRSEYAGKVVHQAYINTCLGGVPEDDREQWLLETIVECGITDRPREKRYRHS